MAFCYGTSDFPTETCPFKQTVSVPNIVPLVNRTDDWHSRLQMEYLPRIAAKHDSETRNCFSCSSLYLSLHFLSVDLLNFDKEVEISAFVHPGKVLLLWRFMWIWRHHHKFRCRNIGPCTMCISLIGFKSVYSKALKNLSGNRFKVKQSGKSTKK